MMARHWAAFRTTSKIMPGETVKHRPIYKVDSVKFQYMSIQYPVPIPSVWKLAISWTYCICDNILDNVAHICGTSWYCQYGRKAALRMFAAGCYKWRWKTLQEISYERRKDRHTNSIWFALPAARFCQSFSPKSVGCSESDSKTIKTWQFFIFPPDTKTKLELSWSAEGMNTAHGISSQEANRFRQVGLSRDFVVHHIVATSYDNQKNADSSVACL